VDTQAEILHQIRLVFRLQLCLIWRHTLRIDPVSTLPQTLEGGVFLPHSPLPHSPLSHGAATHGAATHDAAPSPLPHTALPHTALPRTTQSLALANGCPDDDVGFAWERGVRIPHRAG
jgi:hypothetical protein